MSNLADDDLNWRVEAACRAAWPAAVEKVLPGYVLRRSGGTIRLANSLNPLAGARLAPAAALDAAEAFYGAYGQGTIVRVVGIADEIARDCDRRFYSFHDETCVLLADLPREAPAGDVELTPRASPDWLALRERLGTDGPVYRAMLAAIGLPASFAAMRVDGAVASLAYGAIHGGLLVVESVATDPALRGRGLARRTVGALLAWARGQGAEASCLQVVAANAPARSLYARLGFTRELYRYCYRYAANPPPNPH